MAHLNSSGMSHAQTVGHLTLIQFTQMATLTALYVKPTHKVKAKLNTLIK